MSVFCAGDENSGVWSGSTYLPNDCWEYRVQICKNEAATGRRLYKYVNDTPTLVSQDDGPGAQTSWCVRIVQDVGQATKKVQGWDGADDANLAERLTKDDTANSAADNIYVGLKAGFYAIEGAVIFADNFALVTP